MVGMLQPAGFHTDVSVVVDVDFANDGTSVIIV